MALAGYLPFTAPKAEAHSVPSVLFSDLRKVTRSSSVCISEFRLFCPCGFAPCKGPLTPETWGLSMARVHHFGGRVPFIVQLCFLPGVGCSRCRVSTCLNGLRHWEPRRLGHMSASE